MSVPLNFMSIPPNSLSRNTTKPECKPPVSVLLKPHMSVLLKPPMSVPQTSHVSSSNLPCQFLLISRRKCYQFANIVTRRMTSHYNTDVTPDQKKLLRETNVSRHNMAPLKLLGSSQHYCIVRFKEGPQFGPP